MSRFRICIVYLSAAQTRCAMIRTTLVLLSFMFMLAPTYGQEEEHSFSLELEGSTQEQSKALWIGTFTHGETCLISLWPTCEDFVEAPPRPPEDSFDIRSVRSSGEETVVRDIRDPAAQIEWRIEYQAPDSADVSFSWSYFDYGDDFDETPAQGTLILQQQDGSSVDMVEVRVFDADESKPSVLYITYDATSDSSSPGTNQHEFTYNLDKGWNLVSLPLQVEDNSIAALFPDARGQKALWWNGNTYEQREQIDVSLGYWIYLDEPQQYTVQGDSVGAFSWSLRQGEWNLFGVPNCRLGTLSAQPFTNVVEWSGQYGHNPMYMNAGSGYWWWAGNSGELKVDCDADEGYFYHSGKKPSYAAAAGNLAAPPPAPTLDMLEMPDRFKLLGNYPNPFNPSTNISVELPTEAEVTVDIFDMLGRKVQSFQRHLPAGYHEIPFAANGIDTGLYVYQVTAVGASKTHISSDRMMILK